MHKEKREKTTQICAIFPEGIHTIWFGPSQNEDTEWILGRINLISILTDDDITYVGAIQFNEDLKEVGNDPYPLEVDFDPVDGRIHFHVQGATRKFTEPVSDPFRFMFNGTCEDTSDGMVLSGNGGVPQSFIPTGSSGDPGEGEPGETVSWTSRGAGVSPPKHSK